jgi:hypothetical protein
MVSKWNASFYGFVEADFISDSTESFTESAGNNLISRPGTYTARHKRLTVGARHSRIGFRLGAPEFQGIRTSAQIEADFLGNQPAVTEASTFVNATMRLRHAFAKIETDYIDYLIGQTWQLFGFQGYFHPNTVEIQGVPGQVFSRSPQLRLSHTFKSEPVNVEVAVAASRPPQRDAQMPDGQAGIKFAFNGWKGVHTAGGAGTAVDAMAIAASGVLRRFDLLEPTTRMWTMGWRSSRPTGCSIRSTGEPSWSDFNTISRRMGNCGYPAISLNCIPRCGSGLSMPTSSKPMWTA